MKKIYIEPGLELINIRLIVDVLGPSTEPEPDIPGGGDSGDDPFENGGM